MVTITKAVLRQQMLDRRTRLDAAFVADASEKVKRFLLSMEEFRLAERLGLYAAIRNEVETKEIFLAATELRKGIFLPAVNPKDKTIRYYHVRDWADLSPGFAGILSPKRSRALKHINDLHTILIPGIAFDGKGNRLGFGDGYYDRMLATYEGTRIALAYEFQIVESIPFTPKDEAVDFIVTEERIIRVV